jgi:murein DD-endopeptidase MepM/ murein hydrolase activator NlpD
MALPIKNGKIGTPYGKPGKIWSAGHHQGVDFPCKVGTPVYSVANGTVVEAGGSPWGKNFGNHQVVVRYKMKVSRIRWKTVYAIYAHCSATHTRAGSKVKKGSLIAYSGAEGNVTGPHLHFEVQLQNNWTKTNDVDPQPLLDA